MLDRQAKEQAILTVYNGPDWPWKLKKMPDKRIHAIYMRLLNAGKLK